MSSRLIHLAALALMVGWSAARADPMPAAAHLGASTTALRATSPLPEAVQHAIAAALPEIELDRAHYPDAGRFTPKQIAQVLCGRASNAYVTDFLDANKKLNLSLADMIKPSGDKVYQMRWPACPYVQFLKNYTYTIQDGDTLGSVRQAFTGIAGSKKGIARFFDLSEAVVAKHEVHAGDKVKIPYATLPTTFHLSTFDQIQPIKAAAEKASSSGVAKSLFNTGPPSPPYGSIVTFLADTSAKPVTPPECGTTEIAPFDADKVHATYDFVRGRLHVAIGAVPLFVIDNGFFGVRQTMSGIQAGQHFPAEVFATGQPDGEIGPLMLEGVYPINFQNTPPIDINPVSGHGTHVTGLMLGGTAFEAYAQKTFFQNNLASIQITEINIGRGSDTLVSGSESSLATQFALRGVPGVVNMSIIYAGDNLARNFTFMTHDSVNSGILLYVVAAGNDRQDTITNEYPAALGGGIEPILTVAALNAAGHVANFSNKGATADLAAPGCQISSWIDDKGTSATLNGTSQAAPTVSFAAALLKTVAVQDAYQTKNRLIFSGDLLEAEDRAKLANPVKLNVEKALYVGFDYVRYREDNQDHEILGQVRVIEGATCIPGVAWPGPSSIQSLKVDKSQAAYIFYALPNGQLMKCPANAVPNGRIVINPLFDPSDRFKDISKAQPSDDDKTVPMSEVIEFVRNGPVSPPGRP